MGIKRWASLILSLHSFHFLLPLQLGEVNGDVSLEKNATGSPTGFPTPACYQFVLTDQEYVLEERDTLRLSANKTVAIDAQDFVISPSDSSAHVCFPLSHRLHHCSKWAIPPSDYKIAPDKSLTSTSTPVKTWSLGNYYLTPESAAVVCLSGNPASALGRKRKRCNYLIFDRDEYAILDDGTFWINDTHESLPNANYTLDPTTHAANVCYPLTPEFLSCSWWILEPWEAVVNPGDRSLHDMVHDEVHTPGNYIRLGNSNRSVVCANLGPQQPPIISILHAVASIASAVCLAATIVLHVLLPELSYQRAPLLCHAFSLMVTYICLATRKLGASFDETPAQCYAIFYIAYYFTVAAFTWLSVLAYDVWRISAHLVAGTDGYSWVNRFLSKKFLFYSFFGWGAPLGLTVFVLIVDYHQQIQEHLGLYPQIKIFCWFNETPSAFAFFYGPMCFLLVANFIFFGLSVRNIWMTSRHTEFANTKLNKQLMVICFVVFLAMGLLWLMEVVSASTVSDGVAWIVPDLINASQGIIISAVYTCRPLTWRLLREKLGYPNNGKH